MYDIWKVDKYNHRLYIKVKQNIVIVAVLTLLFWILSMYICYMHIGLVQFEANYLLYEANENTFKKEMLHQTSTTVDLSIIDW